MAERLHQTAPGLPVLRHREPVARDSKLSGPLIEIEADTVEFARYPLLGHASRSARGHEDGDDP